MAFLRFARDKRGIENFYLVQPTTNRRGKVRPRVLYWFRTPPDVRVGREPFDPDVRRALEAQNPGIDFDWRGIVETPIPSADAEKWRERRRAERAAKQAAAEEDARQAGAAPEVTDDLADTADLAADRAESSDAGGPADSDPGPRLPTERATSSLDRGDRRRRRRRRSGGRDGVPQPTASQSSPTTEPSGD